MPPSPAWKRASVTALAALAGLAAVWGFSAAAPPAPAPAAAVGEAPPVQDPVEEQRAVTQRASELEAEAARVRDEQAAAQAAEEARLRAEREAAEAAQRAEAERQAEAIRQAEAEAASQAEAEAAARQAQEAQAAAAAAPAPVVAAPAPAPAPDPAPAPAPGAYIPVVAAGGQAAVDACAGPVRFTPVTVSISIAEHDFCGGLARMGWIQPGTVVTVQGYGTFTAYERMVVSRGAQQGVLAGFSGGYPPIFLQTCIPGTAEMLLIALH